MDKKLLILDIDETLLHASENPLNLCHDFKTRLYYVYKRPYLDQFLHFCREHFKVAIWTTAGEEFASDIVKNIFPADYPLQFIWSRSRCTQYFSSEFMEYRYFKKLKKVKQEGFKLEQVIMVDDTPSKLKRNYGNLVSIKEFYGDQEDNELLKLMNYLLNLNQFEDIRTVEKRFWEEEYSNC